MGSIFNKLNSALLSNLRKAGVYNQAGHFIMAEAVAQNSVVIDLGANKGSFYSTMRDNFGCTCYAVEASPALFKNLPAGPNIIAWNYAIGSTNGTVEFFLSEEAEANSVQPAIAANWGILNSIIVPAITLDKLVHDQKIPLPADLLKIDIEGSEADVINSLGVDTLKRIKQIPVEFHDFLIVNNEYRSAMFKALKKLRASNFLVIRFSTYDYREVLCINKSLVWLSVSQKFRLVIMHPIWRSLKIIHTGISNFFKPGK